MEAVSYTHLDVYKRQAWDFVILQDQSATPVVAPERTMEFGLSLIHI